MRFESVGEPEVACVASVCGEMDDGSAGQVFGYGDSCTNEVLCVSGEDMGVVYEGADA